MKTYTISELAAVDCTSASIEYNTAGADVLTLSGLAPAWVEKLGWQRFEKIVLKDDNGVPLFIGTVTEGREMAAQGAAAPRATFTAQSDFGILSMTPYTALDAQGKPTLAAPFVTQYSASPTVTYSDVLTACFNAAAPEYLTSTLSCTLAGETIPLGQTGATSCGQLMLSALEWAPGAVIRMGYADAAADGAGLIMHIDESSSLPPVTIAADGGISSEGADLGTSNGVTDISLRPRPDLVLPAAALVGAQHYSIGGAANTPGAFVYCVTRPNSGSYEDPENPEQQITDYAPYADPKEKKTIIKGIPIPPRTTLDGDGYMRLRAVDKVTHEALAYCFPILGKMGQGNYSAGAPLLSLTALKDLAPGEAGTDKDEGQPRNYKTDFLETGAYIHVDGTFPASSRPSRNISGLKWCKAELRLVVAIIGSSANITKDEAESFFKGRKKDQNDYVWKYADLTIQCTLINASRRIVKGTKPLAGDPEYGQTDPETPEEEDFSGDAEPDYKKLLDDYFAASQTLYHEGNLTLCKPSVHPGALLGHCIRVQGKLPDWEGMNAICRSISYDLTSRNMTLALGSRDVLGWNQLIEREQASFEHFQNQQQVEQVQDPLTPTTSTETEEEEEAEKEADELMVSPSINASVATTCTGRPHRAFEIYEELTDEGSTTGAWIMQGGSVWVGKKEVKIPSTKTEVVAGVASGSALGDPKTSGRLKRRVYLKTDSQGAEEWTYDITQE